MMVPLRKKSGHLAFPLYLTLPHSELLHPTVHLQNLMLMLKLVKRDIMCDTIYIYYFCMIFPVVIVCRLTEIDA